MAGSALIKKIASQHKVIAADAKKWEERAQRIYLGANPVQRKLIDDTSTFKSALCPRRSGKSFSITSNALWIGEKYPGSRILIISLSLKSTKENFWLSAPGGIGDQNKKYSLGLEFNSTDFVWTHENGSRGRIAGADTRADIESFRGAPAEADAIFIDEAASFAPDLLYDLVFDVLMPGLMTRGGFICLCGTPGLIPQGLFYQATSIVSTIKDEEGNELPTCAVYSGVSQPDDSSFWSLHRWDISDNIAAPEQWKRAQRIKKARGLSDTSPSWRREFLGEWVTDPSELVYYGYIENRLGKCSWNPEYSTSNITGLPGDGGPWVKVMGLDFGYEDDCAIVYAAWSETLNEMRVFHTFKSKHLNVDDFGEKILDVIAQFGEPSVTIGDKGALGKMIVETLNSRYGLSILPADKQLQYDHQELLNADFQAGKIKIPIGSDLDDELCTLQWELTKEKTILVRTGRLREDPKCPNHLCDALLYVFRYCYHFFSRPTSVSIAKGTKEWYIIKEEEALKKLRESGPSSPTNYLSDKFKELKKNDSIHSPNFRRALS